MGGRTGLPPGCAAVLPPDPTTLRKPIPTRPPEIIVGLRLAGVSRALVRLAERRPAEAWPCRARAWVWSQQTGRRCRAGVSPAEPRSPSVQRGWARPLHKRVQALALTEAWVFGMQGAAGVPPVACLSCRHSWAQLSECPPGQVTFHPVNPAEPALWTQGSPHKGGGT